MEAAEVAEIADFPPPTFLPDRLNSREGPGSRGCRFSLVWRFLFSNRSTFNAHSAGSFSFVFFVVSSTPRTSLHP